MRINHSSQPIKKDSLSQLSQQQKEVVPKPVIVQVPPVQSGTPGPVTQQVVQPQNPLIQSLAGGGVANPQTVMVQLPQQGYGDGQSQQQPLVILMPQQVNQSQVQSPVQAQQPIVIVMPQAGGTQMAQPIVVPVPQASTN